MSGLRGSEPSENSATQEAILNDSTRRTFKACRTCRRQKMRCEGREHAPCRRCKVAKVACVFDPVDTMAAREKQKKLKDLEVEVQVLKSTVASLTTPHSSLNEQNGVERQRSSSEQDQRDTYETTPASTDDSASLYSLRLQHLSAPVTAVQTMTPGDASILLRLSNNLGSKSHNVGSTTSLSSTKTSGRLKGDLISRGLISETQARNLFNLYMSGGNLFLPIFDQISDTFESLRRRSVFCFTTVLTVALRATPDPALEDIQQTCLAESRRLAAESLFETHAELENVQAMILLAAYSERNWFAIGHAHQMAVDMGLDNSLSLLLANDTALPTSPAKNKQKNMLARQVRTWLILHHIEQEIASGTARRSRIAYIDGKQLRAFLHHPASSTSDMRIISTIEVVQLRSRFLERIENTRKISGSAMSIIRNAQSEVNHWFKFWDDLHDSYDYDCGSFQRTSLRLQRDYVGIIIACSLLNQLQKETAKEGTNLESTEMIETIRYTLTEIVDLLTFVCQSNSYRWQLKWAPTYSALMVAFIAAFALKLSSLRSDLTNRQSLLSATCSVAQVLEEYPYPNFYLLIQYLISISPEPNEQSNSGGPDYSKSISPPIANDEGGLNRLQQRPNNCETAPQLEGHVMLHDGNNFTADNGAGLESSQSYEQTGLRQNSLGIIYQDFQHSNISHDRQYSPSMMPTMNWMLDTSSLESFGFSEQGNANIFDFDVTNFPQSALGDSNPLSSNWRSF